MATNIGTGPQDIPLNQFLGEMAFMDTPANKVFWAANFNQTSTGLTGAQTIVFENVLYNIGGAYDGTRRNNGKGQSMNPKSLQRLSF